MSLKKEEAVSRLPMKMKKRSVLKGYSDPIRTLRMVRVAGFEPTAAQRRCAPRPAERPFY